MSATLSLDLINSRDCMSQITSLIGLINEPNKMVIRLTMDIHICLLSHGTIQSNKFILYGENCS